MGEFPNKETQFKAGNPGRKPGSRNRQTIIREMIEAAVSDELKKHSGADAAGLKANTVFEAMVAAQVVKGIMSGDTQAFNAIADGAFGKLTDKVENTHTIKQMGKIVAETIPSKPDEEVQSVALTFDIGSEPDGQFPEEEDNGADSR